MSDASRVHFSGLNGLRFIAASLIIIHHIEQYKSWMNLPSLWDSAVIDAIGHQSVSLFFVLSGFLISYLLLVENQKFGTINVKFFYLRRILRIWPLYFLIVAICLALPYLIDTSIFVNIERPKMLHAVPMLLLILPNAIRLLNGNFIGGNQLWSIGVEEQFYILWPWLVRFFKNNLYLFLAGFIGIKLLVTVVLLALKTSYPEAKLLVSVFKFWQLLQIEQMAIGAVGALFLFEKKQKFLDFIFSKPIQYTCILLMVALCVLNPKGVFVMYLEAVVYLVFIMNVSCNDTFMIKLENKLLSKLGNLSYSIYMYHTLAIAFCLYLMHTLHDSLGMYGFNALLYIGSYALTLTVSWFSYYYFETPFLKIKEHFMKIKSATSTNV